MTRRKVERQDRGVVLASGAPRPDPMRDDPNYRLQRWASLCWRIAMRKTGTPSTLEYAERPPEAQEFERRAAEYRKPPAPKKRATKKTTRKKPSRARTTKKG